VCCFSVSKLRVTTVPTVSGISRLDCKRAWRSYQGLGVGAISQSIKASNFHSLLTSWLTEMGLLVLLFASSVKG
jgi:hypothetical protein